MKNIFINIALIALGAVAIISCNKKNNDWNLNPIPTITIDSVIVTPVGGMPTKVAAGTELVCDTSSAVRIYFTTSSKNNLAQISYHDGTWGGGMKLVTSSNETISATPPASKFRPEGKMEQRFHILLPKIMGRTVFSMIVSDEHNMSNSLSYVITPNILVKNK